jgi:exopolysaccharide biosynthesis polyprenyl glycosylphosphotransferase
MSLANFDTGAPGGLHPAPTGPTALEVDVLGAPRARAQAARERTYRRLLAVADVTAVCVAMLSVGLTGPRSPSALALLVAPAMVLLAKATGLYDRDELLVRRSTLDEIPRLFHAATLASLAAWLGQDVLFDGMVGPRSVAVLWATLFVAMVVLRWAGREVAGRVTVPDRCLVIGGPQDLDRLRGKVDPGRIDLLATVPLPVLSADPTCIERIVRRHDAHRLIFAPPAHGAHEETMDAIREAQATGLRVSLMPGVLEAVGSAVQFDELPGLTLLGVRRFGLSRSSAAMKRAFDIVGASAALLILLPVLLVIAVAVATTSRGPVFFTQTRVGRGGRHFRIVKFRTMIDGADAMRDELAARNEAVGGLFKIADDPRMTRVGRWLRRRSLDEVPQFWNVVRGEMSLVGPRPLVVLEDEQVVGRDRHRLTLTPGVTGPWQIAGSARVPLAEMVRMDYMYVASWSLWNDVKICLRTLRHMAGARGQ